VRLQQQHQRQQQQQQQQKQQQKDEKHSLRQYIDQFGPYAQKA